MKSLFHELRICLAEWLLACARDVMPADAREAKALGEAIDGYLDEATWIKRWEKFPA